MPATANPYWIALAHHTKAAEQETTTPAGGFNAASKDLEDLAKKFGHYWLAGARRTPFLKDLVGPHGTAPAATTATKHKTPKIKKAAPTMVKAYEQAIANAPMTKMEQATAKELTPAFNASAAYASGAMTGAAETGAFSQALQALSGAPSNPNMTPASWLSSSLQSGTRVEQPLTSAMAAYGAAQEQQLPSIVNALNAFGQGNEVGLVTAPENAWLNALIAHVGSNVSYYGMAPKAGVTGLPAAIGAALKAYGGAGGAGSGEVALSSLTTKGPYTSVKGATPGVGPGATGTPLAAGAVPPGVGTGQAAGTGGATVRP